MTVLKFFFLKSLFRYVQQKRIKALEAESKLKQVFVPNYTNKSTRLTGSNGEIIIRGKDCDAYPNMSKYSWVQYKKYGKFIPATMSDDAFILDKTRYGLSISLSDSKIFEVFARHSITNRSFTNAKGSLFPNF